jgi:hypothetical protein
MKTKIMLAVAVLATLGVAACSAPEPAPVMPEPTTQKYG